MNGHGSASPAGKHDPWVQWLSTGLIVAGALLLVASAVLATGDAALLLEPGPMAGMSDNPLPVLQEVGTPASLLVLYLTPTATPALSPTSTPTPFPTLSATTRPTRMASQTPVRARPLPSPTSTPSPASTWTPTLTASPTLTPTPRPSATPVTTGPPTRIVAPSINLDSPVVPVGWQRITTEDSIIGVWEVADYAAGWHNTSAVPGQSGNIVISGHHNMHGEVFRYVVDLKPGDAVVLYTSQRAYTYTVESRFIVRDKGMPEAVRRVNARWIDAFPEERLTLVTCWPYNNNTHRVIVVAGPAP